MTCIQSHWANRGEGMATQMLFDVLAAEFITSLDVEVQLVSRGDSRTNPVIIDAVVPPHKAVARLQMRAPRALLPRARTP